MGANEKYESAMHGFIPATDEVRALYVAGTPAHRVSVHSGYAEFDRWLDQIRAEAKAEALRDAADTLNPELINYRRDAMEALSQPIRPAGGDSTMSLQLALVAANRTAEWLRARANQYKGAPSA